MTQELVIGTLLAGLVGLAWVLAYAAFNADRPTPRNEQDRERAPFRRANAA